MKKIVIEITDKQLVGVTTMAAILCAFAVVAGYFWGKEEALRSFGDQLQQESLADRVYTSLVTWYPTADDPTSDTNEEGSDEGDAPEPDEAIGDLSAVALAEVEDVAYGDAPEGDTPNGAITQEPPAGDVVPEAASGDQVRYRAALAGFGSLHAAQKYAQRLNKEGIAAEVIHRESRSARGRKIVWYQVVTPSMPKAALDPLVSRLQQRDRLAQVTFTEST